MDHPMMVKAKEMFQAGDVDGSTRVYSVLLEKHPDMARAHLGYAFLMDRPDGDYAKALFHYQRYLELRPDTQKRKMIDTRIRLISSSFASAGKTNASGEAKRKAALDRENAALKVKNGNLETQLARAQMTIRALQSKQGEVTKQSQQDLARKGPPLAGIQPAVRTVKVQKGDTLRRIAERVYGDQKRWTDIYDANRNLLRMPEDVRVGQVLVLP
jgi:nucleoid-associated protein YgaU